MRTMARTRRIALALALFALAGVCLASWVPSAAAAVPAAGAHAVRASHPHVLQAHEPKATKAKEAKATAKAAPKKAPKTSKKAAKGAAAAALQPTPAPKAAKKATEKKATEKKTAEKKTTEKKATAKKPAHLPPAAERLSAAQQLTKYRRFQRLHPKRARGVEQDLAVFSRNRERVVALNDRFGRASLPTPFRSTGPFMVLTHDEFRKKFLNTKPPTKRKQKNKPLRAPRTRVLKGSPTVTVHKSAKAAPKARAPLAAAAKTAAARAKKATSSFLESSSRNTPVKKANPVRKDGGRVGAAGGAAGKSGQSGGNGRTAEKSGQSGGNGRTAEKSGQSGGNGKTAEKSGQSGGNGKTVDKSGQSGGNGHTAEKSGQSGGNGQSVDKSGQSGGNGQSVDKSGQSGGNGQSVDKSGQSGGNGGNVDKSGQSGGNGGNVDKSGQSGGNGGNADKSGQSGGNGGDADKSGQSGGEEDSIHPDDQSGRRIRTITEGAGPEVVTREVVIASLRAAGAHESLIQSKLGSLPRNEVSIVRGQTSWIKDQRFCGSCWAQSAASSVAMLNAQWENTWLDQRPSVQQLLDCVQTELSSGCKGGTPMDAIDWMTSHRVSTEKDYPDREDNGSGQCRAGVKFSNLQAWGWEPAVPVCEDANPMCNGQQLQELALLDLIVRTSYDEKSTIPILYVDASNWQSYSGGLFPVSMCSSTLEAGNHVVEVAGVGTDAAGVPFWLLRNSWGVEWGENGLIRIPFGVNGCGLANWAIVPSVPEEKLAVDAANRKAQEAEKLLRAGGGKASDYDSNGRFKYDPNQAQWFDARTGRWTYDKPAEADERLATLMKAQASGRTPELMAKMIEDNLRRSRQDAGQEAVAASELVSIPPYDYSIKYDAGMYLDPETGGWTAQRPRHTPPDVGPGQTGGKFVSNSVQGRVNTPGPGGVRRPTQPQPVPQPQPATQPAAPAKPAVQDFTAGGRYKYNAERDTWFDAQAGGWSMTKPAGADIRLKEQELAKLRRSL